MVILHFLDEPSDWGPAGETAVDRFLDTGVGLKASAKKDEVGLPQTGSFFARMKKAAEQSCFAWPCSVLLCFWPHRMVILLSYHATTMQLGSQLSTGDCCMLVFS